MEKLYHWTQRKYLQSILKDGLKTNGMGFIYLTKFPSRWVGLHSKDESILLEIEVPKDIRLSCFEEYKDGTEILCWGNIPINNLKIGEST